MRGMLMATLLAAALLATVHARAADGDVLDGSKVVSLTRFLEEHPLDKDAPAIRSGLIQWEAADKNVVDVVCPGVFAPIPDPSLKYNSELLVQFIFGSASLQLAVPEDNGKLMPAQLAGMTSMLNAYRVLLAADKQARIPRFDALLREESAGTLAQTLEPLVIRNCLPKQAGKDRFPWTLGMTKAQVSAVEGHGPYRNFSNGDLETYNAVFGGHFQNFQFFFRDDRLHRIGIITCEGTDLVAATHAWGELYVSMQRTLGAIETRANKAPANDPDSTKAFEASAGTLVEQGGKAQMAPLQQPTDAFSFASFNGYDVQGTTFYHVMLYFDLPHGMAKADGAKGGAPL